MSHHSKQEVNWEFLLASSKSTLQAYEMSRLNLAANVRKEIVQLLDAWVNENSNALLARWLIERDLAADDRAICADNQPDPQPDPHSVAQHRPNELGAAGGPLPRAPHNAHKPPTRTGQSASASTQNASDKIFGDKPFTTPRIHATS